MIKHTPGPWITGKRKGQEIAIDAMGGDPTLRATQWKGLAVVYGCDDMLDAGEEVMLANARLITAAPELLDALQLAQRNSCRADWPDDINAAMDEAIAKATGESP